MPSIVRPFPLSRWCTTGILVMLLSAPVAPAHAHGYSGSYMGGHSYGGYGNSYGNSYGGRRTTYSSGSTWNGYRGGGSYNFTRSYGGPTTNNGYTGPGGGMETPHRGVWQTRYSRWAQAENARRNTVYVAPCGIYGRAPAGCRLVTMPYIPWIHGDR